MVELLWKMNLISAQETDNLLINCLLQKLYVGCALVYDPPVDLYTHWVNAHIVCNTSNFTDQLKD